MTVRFCLKATDSQAHSHDRQSDDHRSACSKSKRRQNSPECRLYLRQALMAENIIIIQSRRPQPAVIHDISAFFTSNHNYLRQSRADRNEEGDNNNRQKGRCYACKSASVLWRHLLLMMLRCLFARVWICFL